MKTSIEVVRGNKFLVSRNETWLEDSAKIYVDTYNRVIKKYLPWLQQQELDDTKKSCFSIYDIVLKTDQPITYEGKQYDLKVRKNTPIGFGVLTYSNIIKMFSKEFGNICHNFKDSIMAYINDRLKSRAKRGNKKTYAEFIKNIKRPPILRRPTIHLKHGLKIKDGVLSFKNYSDGNREYTEIPYEEYIGKTKISELISGTDSGGNIKIGKGDKRHEIIISHKRILKFDYAPAGWIGFDINIDQDYWLTFYDSNRKNFFVWERKGYSQDIVDEVKDNCKELNNQKNSKARRPYQKKRKTLQKKQERYIRKCFKPLLSKIHKAKKGLAIDDASFGAGSGSYYQDIINKIVPKMCEEMAIPYLRIDCRFTTRDCSECGKRNKRPKDYNYSCSCGYKDTTHVNSAKNITNKALEVWAKT